MDPRRRRKLLLLVIILFLGFVAFIAAHFPYDTDTPLSDAQVKREIEFYRKEYEAARHQSESAEEQDYVQVAQGMSPEAKIKLERFVSDYSLQRKKVLEIGSGSGYMQNIVTDYTGLDISSTAARFYKKPFYVGSATALPFPDNSFDSVWSIWVLEHVQNPEQALKEMRRVVKPNGLIYLRPAWYVVTWLGQGYGVRPYSDFDLKGKIIKASVPLRSRLEFRAGYIIPIRLIRLFDVWVSGSQSALHYRRLNPNYETYWGPDSDAVNSIDPYEAYLWFTSRGDECLNWPGGISSLSRHERRDALIIRVKKP